MAVAALAGAGCDEDAPACMGGFITQRNPATLVCTERQLASPDCPNISPPPPWPGCRHPCEAIGDQATCAAEPGCRVVLEKCGVFDDRCEREGPFIGCFPIGTAEPATDLCADLDVYECATREDCGGQYLHGPDCPQGAAFDGPSCHFSFVTCFDEQTAPP